MTYFAHSGLKTLEEDGEPLARHLADVSAAAAARASAATADPALVAAATAAGLFHDLGKTDRATSSTSADLSRFEPL